METQHKKQETSPQKYKYLVSPHLHSFPSTFPVHKQSTVWSGPITTIITYYIKVRVTIVENALVSCIRLSELCVWTYISGFHNQTKITNNIFTKHIYTRLEGFRKTLYKAQERVLGGEVFFRVT